MGEQLRAGPIKLRVTRVVIVYILVGGLLGALSAAVQRWTGISSPYAGGFLVGMVVFVAPILNRLTRSGRARWLVRE